MPTSRLSAQMSGPNGITTITRIVGTSTTAGASENTHRSAARGITSSFWMNLTPSAISWPSRGTGRPPWGRAGAACGPGSCAPRTPPRAGPPGRSPSPGPPSGAARSRRSRTAGRRSSLRALPGGLLAWPRLRQPGGEREVLPEREPLELLGEQQLHQLRVALEVDPEELPGLTFVPVRSGIQVGDRRQPGLVLPGSDHHPNLVPAGGWPKLDHHLQPLVSPGVPAPQIGEITSEVAVVTKGADQVEVAVRSDPDHGLVEGVRGLQQILAEPGPEPLGELSCGQGPR